LAPAGSRDSLCSMKLVEQVSRDLTAAMKAQDAARTSVLRMAKAALKNKEIEKKAPLDEDETVKVLQTLVRQREDSIEQFNKGNRPELAAKEEAEILVLRAYLPQPASEAEIATAVEHALTASGATSVKDLGKVMKAALAQLQGLGKPVDGKQVSEAARRRLS
jgi:uncharacterized protein